ncbi:unnamed protein product [Phytophthora fragariaefolia]|uniref:Unnamed protein product n=1 Tax=Phytophthora fragariaefolia TaxID=1490495 RepID=A0A9W6XZ85_9STRA|nr:unnamed protein product [Phytophthora fragariaefolia]
MQTRNFLLDIQWLKQEWRFVQAHPVEPFSLETKTNGLLHSEAAKVHEALADDGVKKYSMLSLMTELKTKSGRSLVKFRDVVSGVLRCGMLNDAVIDMGVTMIAESVQGCVAFSSLSMVVEWPTPPRQWLSETPYIIVPLHLSTNHWGVIIVEIGFPTTLKVYFYEPLHQECYRKEISNAWKNGLLPYLEKWHIASGAKECFPKEIITKWISEPTQPDLKSCGVMVLGIVYAYVRNTYRFERHLVTDAYLSVMRLRLAWLLLCSTERAPPSDYNLVEMQTTDQEISNVLKPQRST